MPKKTSLESRSNRLTSQLDIVKQLTISDLKQRDLAQTIAQIKYRTLIQQQDMEKKVLDLQIKQNQAALEKEKIQLRVQQAQNKAEVLGAYAELQTTLATPTSTDAQKYAAQLNLQAKLEQGASLKFQEAQLPDREKLQNYLDASQRQNLADQQLSAQDNAKMEIINTLAPVDKALATREFRAEKVGQLLGVNYDRRNEGDVFQALRKGNKSGLADIFGGRELSDRAFNYGYSNPGYSLTPQVAPDQVTAPSFNSVNYEETRRNFLAQMQEFAVPNVKLPPLPQLQNPPALGRQEAGGRRQEAKQPTGGTITVERVVIEQVTVEVNSDATPQDAAKEVRNAIMDELYNLGTKVKTKL